MIIPQSTVVERDTVLPEPLRIEEGFSSRRLGSCCRCFRRYRTRGQADHR